MSGATNKIASVVRKTYLSAVIGRSRRRRAGGDSVGTGKTPPGLSSVPPATVLMLPAGSHPPPRLRYHRNWVRDRANTTTNNVQASAEAFPIFRYWNAFSQM